MRRLKIFQNIMFVVFGVCAVSLIATHLFFRQLKTASSYSGQNETPYESSFLFCETYDLQIRLSQASAELIVNGEKTARDTKNGQVYSLKVSDGDVISMDLRQCEKGEVYAYVVFAPKELAFPQTGTKVLGEEGIVALFKISSEKKEQ